MVERRKMLLFGERMGERKAQDRSVWEKIMMRSLEFVDTEEKGGGEEGRNAGKSRR